VSATIWDLETTDCPKGSIHCNATVNYLKVSDRARFTLRRNPDLMSFEDKVSRQTE